MGSRGAGTQRGLGHWLLVAFGSVTALVVVAVVVVVSSPALQDRLVERLGAGRGAGVQAGAQSQPVQKIARGERPLSADAFVDSVGVNTHLHYEDTSYARFDELVRPRLREMGVRHLRDAAYTTPDAEPDAFFYERVRALAADGMDFQYTVSAEPDGTTDFTRLRDIVESSGGAVTAFEGLNEPDLSGLADWPGVTRKVQEALHAAVGALGPDAPDVVLPSVTTLEAAAELGDLSGLGDVANVHSYYAARQPETTGFGDDGYGSLPWNFRLFSGVMGPGLPVTTTETGYYSARGGEFWVSPETKATYIPRLLMHQFANGVSRTYLYELLDQFDDPDDPQDDFGLIEDDGTPKASFIALRDLIDVLEDPGPDFATTRVDVTVDAAPDIAQVLLQKRDGRTYVVLWDTRPVWDVLGYRPLEVSDREVTLDLPDQYAVTRVVRLGDSAGLSEEPVPAAGPTARVAVGSTLTLVELTPGAP